MRTVDTSRLPADAVETILNYLWRGLPPGGFIRAVLNNDLVEAAQRADSRNLGLLPEYASFMVNSMPEGSWRHAMHVDHWIDECGLQGGINTGLTTHGLVRRIVHLFSHSGWGEYAEEFFKREGLL